VTFRTAEKEAKRRRPVGRKYKELNFLEDGFLSSSDEFSSFLTGQKGRPVPWSNVILPFERFPPFVDTFFGG
jgi:hypothetical protein